MWTWNFTQFMKSESLLPCLKESTTGPSPEPDQSSPHHPILSVVRSYSVFFFFKLHLGIWSNVFPSRFSTITLYGFLFSARCTKCCAHLILHNFLTLIVFGITNHKAPHHSVYFCLLIWHLRPKSFLAPFSWETKFLSHRNYSIAYFDRYALNSKWFWTEWRGAFS